MTAVRSRGGAASTSRHHDPCGARAQAVNGATPADTARRGGRREDRSTNVPAGHHRLGRSGPGTHGVVVDRAARPAAPYWLSSFVGLRLFSAPTDVAALCLRDRISVTFVHIPPGRGPPAAREPEAVRAHCSPTMIVLVRHGRQEAYASLHSTDACTQPVLFATCFGVTVFSTFRYF